MKASEIEAWALRTIDALEATGALEDTRVELKADWVAPEKAARRVAGHANAAHGEPVLWLFGVSEKDGALGVEAEDFANWWAQVRATLQPPHPYATPLNIHLNKKTVVALLIETDRAPYLVKNPSYGKPGGGPVQYEIPWREMTALRTATNADLIRMLAPQQQLPVVEIITASLRVSGEKTFYAGNSTEAALISGNPAEWKLWITIYLTPPTRNLLVFPGHRYSITVQDTSTGLLLEFENKVLKPGRDFGGIPGPTFRETNPDIRFESPSTYQIMSEHCQSDLPESVGDRLQATVRLPAAGSTREVVLRCEFKKVADWNFQFVTWTATNS